MPYRPSGRSSGEDNFPDVFANLEPTPPLGPPPASSGLSQQTADAVARSVVKVEGVACRKIQDGTGFVVADGLVATNAHVVAGESSTEVIRDDGERLSADGGGLRRGPRPRAAAVPALDRPALPLATADSGRRRRCVRASAGQAAADRAVRSRPVPASHGPQHLRRRTSSSAMCSRLPPISSPATPGHRWSTRPARSWASPSRSRATDRAWPTRSTRPSSSSC